MKSIKYRLLVGLILVISCIIIEVTYTRAFNSKYHCVFLENASCQVPKRMWRPEEDYIYISNHMFYIVDDKSNYIIYGSQLEKFDDEDIKTGMFNTEDNSELINVDSINQLQKLIKENSSLLYYITDYDEYSRSTFNSYRISGIAEGKYKGYKSYISALKQYDMFFLEVILYREPETLSYKEMKELMLNINWHKSTETGDYEIQ